MQSDLYLVIGIVVGVLAFPSLIGAFSQSRPPRAAAVMVVISGVLIVLAVRSHPGGYKLEDVPRAFTRVIASVIR